MLEGRSVIATRDTWQGKLNPIRPPPHHMAAMRPQAWEDTKEPAPAMGSQGGVDTSLPHQSHEIILNLAFKPPLAFYWIIGICVFDPAFFGLTFALVFSISQRLIVVSMSGK